MQVDSTIQLGSATNAKSRAPQAGHKSGRGPSQTPPDHSHAPTNQRGGTHGQRFVPCTNQLDTPQHNYRNDTNIWSKEEDDGVPPPTSISKILTAICPVTTGAGPQRTSSSQTPCPSTNTHSFKASSSSSVVARGGSEQSS